MSSKDSCKRELQIAIPWEEVQEQTDKIVASIRRTAKIPGFRPGKAPAPVVKSRYSEEIRKEIVEQLVPKHFWDEAKQKDLHVIGSPDVHDLEFADGEPMRFRAEFEVSPEFELGDYRRIEVPYSEPEVTDEQVEDELGRMREQQATFVNLDPRPLEIGDIAVLALKSEAVGDAPQVDQDDTTIKLGEEGTLPDFTENLLGKSPGDEVDFTVNYPEDFGNEKLAGQAIPFHATVKGLRKKELPELDDEFAADLGDFKSVDEVRAKIRDQMEEHFRHQATEAGKNKLMDKLIDSHDFAVPEKLIEQQVVRRLERWLSSLQRQGVDIDKLNLDWRKARDNEQEPAIRDVKAGLILERIAKVESISATPEEINQQVTQYATQSKKSVEAARKQLAEDGTLDRIQGQISNDKALSFLFDEAEKVDVPPEEPEEAASDTGKVLEAGDTAAADDSAEAIEADETNDSDEADSADNADGKET